VKRRCGVYSSYNVKRDSDPVSMPTTLQPGGLAPNFELLTSEGVPYSLSSARGSNVVIYFYPKADTPG